MLDRLDSIRNIGLFRDYAHSSGCALGETTLIYGENGVGKSTLAALLDSLRECNPVEILKRRTLPGDVTPTATVSFNDDVYIFDGHEWDKEAPHETLEVFYPGFVLRNVHAATGVDPEHRRNLCELVLGRSAIANLKRLTEADAEARAALHEKNEVEASICLLIEGSDSLDSFIGFTPAADIDAQIEEARSELRQAQSREAILARAVPEPIALPEISSAALESILRRSADDIGADTAALVREHISRCLDSEGEQWLARGSGYVGADNRCPFCGQDLVGSPLAEAIRGYYSTEYQEYTDSLLRDADALRETMDMREFARLRAGLASQVAIAAQWSDVVTLDQSAIASTLAKTEAAWSHGFAEVQQLISNKQTQPLRPMETGLADAALREYRQASEMLLELNGILAQCAARAEERKAAISGVDMAILEERVAHLENQKRRFEPRIQDLIGKRNALIAKRAELAEEKTALRKTIDDHADLVVGKYQNAINHYLEFFGCDIRIDSVEPKYPSGKASIHYKLRAHGHEIPLGISDDAPCFETVLSEGDKNILALSFFFARLKDHQSLAGRTIVLDDPVNSMGSSRRTLVEAAVRDLHVRGAQVVVLTHDERLAALLWRDNKLKGIVALEVERTAHGSGLKPWDVEKATQSDYVEDYLTLADYLENGGDHKKVAGCIRPYVEQRLRHLYPGPPLETRDSLGQMISKIRDSRAGSRLYPLKTKLPDLEAINDASLPSHHATDDVPGLQALSKEEVRIFAEKALAALG